MSTIHNPTQFQPQDYEVYTYLDNNPFSGMGFGAFATPEMIEAHRKEMKDALGENYTQKCYRCDHCGNGTVRYIAVCIHIPTNERIVLGSECVKRLGFKDGKEFQLARIKSAAEATRIRLGIFKARHEFLEANPEVKAAVTLAEGIKNLFIQDVIAKLNTYGNLSERQAAALVTAVGREIKREEEKKNAPVLPPAGPAPVGKQSIEGTLVFTKVSEGPYGDQLKMLVQLENGSKVFGTCPVGLGSDDKGAKIRFTATFTPKREDNTFAFFSRPSKAEKV